MGVQVPDRQQSRIVVRDVTEGGGLLDVSCNGYDRKEDCFCLRFQQT